MILTNSYLKLFTEIQPAAYQTFLKQNGWTCDFYNPTMYSIWHSTLKNGFSSEIVIPLTNRYKDTNDIITRNISILLDHYNINVEKLLNKLKQETKDLVRIRIVHDDVKDGMIPLEDGVKLISSAKDLMSTSALCVISKKRIYFGKPPELAERYINNLKLGQTEIGSYIINVFSIIESEADPSLFEMSPFSRRVTDQLIQSIDTLKQVTKDYKKKEQLGIFDEAVSGGVSANLCNSILKFSGSEHSRNVILNINIENDINKKDTHFEYFIKNEDMPIISIAYDYLLNKNYFENYELEGYVVKLARDELSQSGEITISTIIFDKQRLVRAFLTAAQYDIAISAHKIQKMVRIIGDLTVESRKAEIINIKDILISEK